MKPFCKAIAATLTLVAIPASAGAQDAAVVVTKAPAYNAAPLSPSAMRNAKGVLPMIRADQLPRAENVSPTGSKVLPGNPGSPNAPKPVIDTSRVEVGPMISVEPQAFGRRLHPFTTKGAYSAFSNAPTQLYPWRAAGKLYMEKGSSSFICTASLITKGILVTAAHCVWDYGVANSAPRRVTWVPSQHDNLRPYGTYVWSAYVVPGVYKAGTDECTVKGVVCANDVALIVLARGSDGKYPGEKVGWYRVGTDGFGYVKSPLFGNKTVAAITQLGYPGAYDDGLRMIRTDSVGYYAAPNNVIIGSDQTGGSSGGPWIVNFGIDPVTKQPGAKESVANVVIGTTSWGYNSGIDKQQGASRFGKNSRFKTKANIVALLEAVCASNSPYRDRC